MEADLQRPPATIGPRTPAWPIVTLLFFAFVVLLSAYALNLPTVLLIFLPGFILVIALSVYCWTRFGVFPLGSGPLTSHDPIDLGNPEDQPRLADPQERSAQRDLRRGRISRLQYERVIAYRHFVHGEISGAEYHHIISELDKARRTDSGHHKRQS